MFFGLLYKNYGQPKLSNFSILRLIKVLLCLVARYLFFFAAYNSPLPKSLPMIESTLES